MEVNNYKRKFKLLFDKFFQENFELNSYYSENLLKYLEERHETCHAGKILDTPFFSDLIMYSLTNLETATTSVKTFIMQVITIMLKNELQFSKVAQLQGFRMMADKLCSLHMSVPPTALHLAGIKVAIAQTSHYSGVMWLVEFKVWRHIMPPTIHRRAIKVARAAYNFVSKLVWKLNEYDEEAALIEVLEYVVEPIKSNEYNNIRELDAENEKALYEPTYSYLNALLAIVKGYESSTGANKVMPLLTRYFIVEAQMHIMLEVTRDFDLVSLLTEINFHFLLALCKDAANQGNGKAEIDIPTVISTYCNIVQLLIMKRMIPATMAFTVNCVVIWSKADTKMFPATFERHGRTFDVRNQFMLLVLAPLLTHASSVHDHRKNAAMIEALNVYALKLSKLGTEHIIKACYSMRAVIESIDSKIIAIQCLREIFKLKGYLNESQAGMLYQALFYTLQLHVIYDGSGGLILDDTLLKSPADVKLLSLVMEAIKMLLKEHNINWYENVEIICLQTTLMDLLKQTSMPTKQLLQAVDLIDLSIKKFLSPDMALLMESKAGSTLNEIGAVMRSYIQHEEWEVRDSALQLLLSCTEVAFIKYIPLQKLLLENKLMVLAAHAALSDPEYYVQTTALKCLAAATKIRSIWQEVLAAHNSLYVQLIFMLKNNSEGIVRKEAVNTLTEVFVNQKLTIIFTRSLYNAMADAALNDLHWEVQIAALNFWKHAIRNQMSQRGMIGGKFPSVTFSKEKRKIIVLNDKEITNQLNGILNELSSIGCVTVLYKCLNEEYNTVVMEAAYNAAKELVTILDYYKFEEVSDENAAAPQAEAINEDSFGPRQGDTNNEDIYGSREDRPATPQDIEIKNTEEEAMDLTCVPSRDQIEFRERVINSIVETTEHDLIAECYDNYAQRKSEHMDEDVFTQCPIIKAIEPNKFLKKIKATDYLSILDDKKKWCSGPSNLDLLLDEILALGEVSKDITDECN